MYSLQTFLLLLLMLVLKSVTSRELPSFVKPCKRDEIDLNKCVVNQINDMRNELSDGIKEFGLPPLKGIKVPELSLTLNSGNSNMSVIFKDLLFGGAENFILKNINVDVDKRIFDISMLVPAFQMTAKYNMKGRLILIEMDAKGDIGMNFTNVLITSKFIGEYYDKNGGQHMKFNADEFDVLIDDMSIEFHDLINGNPEITTVVNGAFKEYSKSLLTEVRPAVSEAIKQLITAAFNGVFSRFTFDQLFPKN